MNRLPLVSFLHGLFLILCNVILCLLSCVMFFLSMTSMNQSVLMDPTYPTNVSQELKSVGKNFPMFVANITEVCPENVKILMEEVNL